MRWQSTSLVIVALLLVTASLACGTFSGGGVKNLQATANAALTQGAAAGGAAQATASAALTQAAAGASPAATTQSGAATPAATSATTGGGPSDVPFINATNTILLASAEQVGYYTSADLATTVKFYKDQMPKSGWTFNVDRSFENQAGSVLNFTKDNRTATATITSDPTKKQTLVAIAIVSH